MGRFLVRSFNFSIVLLALSLLAFTAVRAEAASGGGASGAGVDIEKLESVVAALALKGDWEAVVVKGRTLLKASPDSADLFGPVLVHALIETGDKEGAASLLQDNDDAQTRLLLSLALSRVSGEETSVPGTKEPVRDAATVFVKVKVNGGALGLGIFPKQAEKMALRKALNLLLPEPTREQRKLFNETVMAEPKAYFLAGEVLVEGEKSVICIAFVNMAAMKDALAIYLDRGDKERVSIGVLTREGSDANRKALEKTLTQKGFVVKDLGRGDFYAMGDRVKVVGIVVELSESASVSKGVLGSNFKNISATVNVAFYNTSNGKDLARLGDSFSLVHMNETAGREKALGKTYSRLTRELITKLASVENKVKWFAGGVPPVELSVETNELFASNYKFYAGNPFGTLTIKNNTERTFGGVKVSFNIKDYVDFPTQIDVGEVKAGETVTRDLSAIFNSAIINLTDDTFLQSELKATYFDLGKEHDVTTTHPVFVYEKHALVWDDKGKVASFITPRDPVVVGFASKALYGNSSVALPKNMIKARDVFGAMGVLGIEYLEDPNNPYSVVSGITTVVDYVQFPRETLERKRGDCDDLTSLYVSSLESLGIRTKLLDAPGHIFMFLDTGIEAALEPTFGFPEDLYVIDEGKLWVPVEVTRVGSSFTVAWQKGAERYNKYREEIRIIQLAEARRLYPAPNLPAREFNEAISRDALEKMFPGELDKLEEERFIGIAGAMEELGEVGLGELMFLYSSAGRFDAAAEAAERLLALNDGSAALNNAGNIYFLKGDAVRAAEYYAKASEKDSDDSAILINLARAYIKAGEMEKARDAFGRAVEMDPALKERNIAIQMELRKK